MTSSRETISVVVPTYNRPDSLQTAIDCVKRQTHAHIEVIIVDDHSNPPVADFLNTANSTLDITIYRHSSNKGAPTARATGIKHSNGDFIAFLDDDDIWHPKKIERQLQAFRRNNDVGLVYVGRRFTDSGDVVAERTPSKSGDVHKSLLCGNFIGTYSVVMIRSEVVDDIGMPDTRFPTEQDWEWYIRIARNWEFIGIPEPLVTRVSGRDQQISSNYNAKRTISYPLIMSKYEDDATKYGDRFRQYWRSKIYFKAGWEAIVRTEQPKVARQYFLKSLRHYPLNYSSWLFLAITPIINIIKRLPRSIKQKIGYQLR